MTDTPLPHRTGIGSDANAGERFERLVEIMRGAARPRRLSLGIAEQTHASLRPFVLEETYEVLEAIESGTPHSLQEELGDFLFEAVFLAQISDEAGDFTIADAIDASKTSSCGAIPTFLRAQRRPPLTSRPGIEKWETMKARERVAGRRVQGDHKSGHRPR